MQNFPALVTINASLWCLENKATTDTRNISNLNFTSLLLGMHQYLFLKAEYRYFFLGLADTVACTDAGIGVGASLFIT